MSVDALCAFISSTVASGAAVKTDGWPHYRPIAGLGYTHHPTVIGNPKKASKLFPRVHRVFGLLDRWLLGTMHGSVSRRHLPRYLDEFVFRFNRRNSGTRALLVDRLLGRVFRAVPIYRELVAPEPLLLVPT